MENSMKLHLFPYVPIRRTLFIMYRYKLSVHLAPQILFESDIINMDVTNIYNQSATLPVELQNIIFESMPFADRDMWRRASKRQRALDRNFEKHLHREINALVDQYLYDSILIHNHEDGPQLNYSDRHMVYFLMTTPLRSLLIFLARLGEAIYVGLSNKYNELYGASATTQGQSQLIGECIGKEFRDFFEYMSEEDISTRNNYEQSSRAFFTVCNYIAQRNGGLALLDGTLSTDLTILKNDLYDFYVDLGQIEIEHREIMTVIENTNVELFFDYKTMRNTLPQTGGRGRKKTTKTRRSRSKKRKSRRSRARSMSRRRH